MSLVRATIAGGLAAALSLGALALLAGVALGGAAVEVQEPVPRSDHLGLDSFVLDLFLLVLALMPLERIVARRREQPIPRAGWHMDVAHFFVSPVDVQILTAIGLSSCVSARRAGKDVMSSVKTAGHS